MQTLEQPLQLCPILHNGTVTFQEHPTHTDTEGNDQPLHGMKRDYTLSPANQMKEQKNCIRCSNNRVTPIEGHQRLQLLGLNTEYSIPQTQCLYFPQTTRKYIFLHHLYNNAKRTIPSVTKNAHLNTQLSASK